MQISKVYFLTAFLTILPGALAGPCKPSYTCDGDLKCCTMKLQGNVGAYCTYGNMPDTGCGTNNVICCKKDAVKSLTPRGYTYAGCSNPGISEIC